VFRPPCNIGVVLGHASGGLVDIDLDALEAGLLADVFLPATGSVFGREGKPRSHRLYVCDPPPAYVKLADHEKKTLVELRSTGQQTVFPASTHDSGEKIVWVADGEPQAVDGVSLATGVRHLAVAALLARLWLRERGVRHDLALAVAGFLLRRRASTRSRSRKRRRV
jgi:hypothetical protein